MKNNPEVMTWNGMKLVRISDVGERFSKWLNGQTIPLVEDNKNPTDWAYYQDYVRFVNNLRVID
jgi:hypothetical protein